MIIRSLAIQNFLDKMKDGMREDGMTDEDINVLDVGSSHPYECKCDTCNRWWELMGPEE